MKKTLLLILLVFTISFCFGQINSNSVPFVAYWNVGDSYDFQVTHLKTILDIAEEKGKRIDITRIELIE